MKELKLKVEGMVCGGCENRAKNALNLIDGVTDVIADHNNGTIIIKSDKEIDKNLIKEKVEDLGFEVKEI